MRKAKVFVDARLAGCLEEIVKGKTYRFSYLEGYDGQPISLLMPVNKRTYDYDVFPSFFDGLLPEGFLLQALLKRAKIDDNDLFQQLITVGHDLVGNVTIEEWL